jgi:plastocyanin
MQTSCRVALATLALAFAAFPAAAANHFVNIEGTTFVPPSITVRAGDTVIWSNTDILNHTVTSGNPCSPDGIFNSGVLDPETGIFSFTFTNVGTFKYYCLFHCLGGMRGDVTVDPAPTPVELPTPVATLGQNFPNPFNPKTTIEYSLPTRSRAVLAIYDSEGSLVMRMDQGVRDAGTHRIEWDGRDASGAAVGSGVYFYRLEGVAGVMPRKMVLLK